jgi:hypothetical protein
VTLYLTDVAGWTPSLRILSFDCWINPSEEIQIRVDFRNALFGGLFVHVGDETQGPDREEPLAIPDRVEFQIAIDAF